MDEGTKSYLLKQAKDYGERRTQLAGEMKLADQHRFDIKRVEARIADQIARDPLMTNDAKRKAALYVKLEETEDWKKLQNQLGFCEDHIKELEAEIDCIKMNVRVWDIVTRDVVEVR